MQPPIANANAVRNHGSSDEWERHSNAEHRLRLAFEGGAQRHRPCAHKYSRSPNNNHDDYGTAHYNDHDYGRAHYNDHKDASSDERGCGACANNCSDRR